MEKQNHFPEPNPQCVYLSSTHMVCWWVLVLSGLEKPADFFAGLQNISWN
jgi:hypothetical protein